MATSKTVKKNRFNETFGYPKDAAATKSRDYLTPWVREFIQRAPFVVMATGDVQGSMDASPKGGKPGFVQVLDERHLLIPRRGRKQAV